MRYGWRAVYCAPMHLDTWIRKRGRGSVAKLADACSVGWQTIHHIRNGRRTPSLEIACRIVEATGGQVTIDDLRECSPGKVPGPSVGGW